MKAQKAKMKGNEGPKGQNEANAGPQGQNDKNAHKGKKSIWK